MLTAKWIACRRLQQTSWLSDRLLLQLLATQLD
jgi:hypothetical protein